MTSTEPDAPRDPSVHLAWALPLALVVSLPVLFVGNFLYCGIGGCGGPFTYDYEDRNYIWVFCVIVGLIFAGVLTLAPWTSPLRRRLVISVAVGVGAGLAAGVYFLVLP